MLVTFPKVFEGDLIDFENARAAEPGLFLLWSQLLGLIFDVEFFCQILHRFGERHVVEHHHERYGIAFRTTSEAGEDSLYRGHFERRCLFLVKGTAAFVIDAGPLQTYSFAPDYRNDVFG